MNYEITVHSKKIPLRGSIHFQPLASNSESGAVFSKVTLW